MTYLYQYVFLHVTLNFFFIAWLFWRSKNGRLRKLMVLFFLALGWASALRIVTPYLLAAGASQEIVNMFVGVPVLVTGSMVCHYLFKAYGKR